MSPVRTIDSKLLRRMPLPWPEKLTDKDARGKVVVAGGSVVSAGAVELSGLAALRAGAGKVLLAVPRPISTAVAIKFPEAGVTAFSVSAKGHPSPSAARQIIPSIPQADAFLLGPGLAEEKSAQKLAHVLLQHASDVTFIIDAMCVTGLWDHRRLTSRRKRQLIITPHPGEMAALTGLSKSHINHDPVSVAEKVASHLQCVVVLKGSSTVVAQPDGPSYRYPGGGVGLATSGSGDVLAGVLAGLVARGAPAVEAAIWSVYLHGEAGRRLAERIGPLGFLARELPLEIPGLMAAFPG